jgi:hypothetical protein
MKGSYVMIAVAGAAVAVASFGVWIAGHNQYAARYETHWRRQPVFLKQGARKHNSGPGNSN